MGYRDRVDFSTLVGKTLKAINGDKGSDKLIFETTDGESYIMLHRQDCCESVDIEDIAGDLKDLIGNPILLAEEVSSGEPDAELKSRRDQEKAEAEANGRYYYGPESETWTFYKLATIKGSVTIRWYGTSNGYYGEGVDFEKMGAENENF